MSEYWWGGLVGFFVGLFAGFVLAVCLYSLVQP